MRKVRAIFGDGIEREVSEVRVICEFRDSPDTMFWILEGKLSGGDEWVELFCASELTQKRLFSHLERFMTEFNYSMRYGEVPKHRMWEW